MSKRNFIKTLLKSSTELGRALQQEKDPKRRRSLVKSWMTIAGIVEEWTEKLLMCDDEEMDNMLTKTELDIEEQFPEEYSYDELDESNLDELDSFIKYDGKKVEA